MRAVFGLLLIMLGLAMAVVWMPEHNGERQLAVVTDIATQGIGRKSESDKSGRTFSPQAPLLATIEQPGARAPQHTVAVARVVTAPQVEAPVATVAPSAPIAATAGFIAAAVTNAGIVAPATVAAPAVRDLAPNARAGSSTELPRDELVRNLQRELKRVGCYWGDVDGDWGTGSRRAMSNFTERVNASLPIEQPDFVLLSLLRGHQGTACGKGCPAGQTVSESGRCLPNSVMAQARRVQERRSGSETGPVVAALVQPVAPASAWDGDPRTRVVRSTSNEALAPSSAAAAGAAAATVAAVVAPLPGRMAMGGPQSGSGAYVTRPDERSPARDAVRSAEREQQADTASQRAPQRHRRIASRRGAPQAVAYRYAYQPVYRAPRYVAPSFASAPRRAGRSWTATFFGN